MKRRVLLAWEMGEGLAHAARLLLVASRLRDMGWLPTVAARTPEALAERYRKAGIPVIPCPPHRNCYQGNGPFRAATFADVMGVCGYADRQALTDVTGAWDAVLDEHRPDLVIADYSPLLSLAAFGRCPLIAIGDGFVTPPALAGGTFPPLGATAPAVWDPVALLENAQAVQAGRGLDHPASLAHIMTGCGQVVAVPPEIDIYGSCRSHPAAGAWLPPPPPLPVPSGRRLFAYLRAHEPASRMVLQAVVDHRLPMEAFLHDATPAIVGILERAGIQVHRSPPLLREALARCTLLIHHGGIGSLEDAALAGRPQLLLPRHLEQDVNAARALKAVPGTFVLGRSASMEAVRDALPKLLADTRALNAAQASAARLTARRETAWDALQALLDRIF